MNMELIAQPPREPNGLPINVSLYKRSQAFSGVEFTALQSFALHRIGKAYKRWKAGEDVVLDAIAQPIVDVLNAVDGPPDTEIRALGRRAAVTLLLREMYQRNKTLWSWANTEWQDILCPSHQAFEQRYKINAGARFTLLVVAYVLGEFSDFHLLGQHYSPQRLAKRIFGETPIDAAIQRIFHLLQSSGYSELNAEKTAGSLCEALLVNRSVRIEDLTLDILRIIRSRAATYGHFTRYTYTLSIALTHLGILERPLLIEERWGKVPIEEKVVQGIAPEWVSWCKRWRDTTTLQPGSKRLIYYETLTIGRWLAQTHPEITSPEQWTRELAAEYVAMITHITMGQWTSGITPLPNSKIGQPASAATKSNYLSCMRTFFRDAQEWGWISRRFDPMRVFATPPSLLKLIGPKPRVIADDIWAKLLTAGLNLKEEDLPAHTFSKGASHPRTHVYPLAMVQAIVVIWLFSGLRRDEIRRLRLGCIRWQTQNQSLLEQGGKLSDNAVCFLDVPVNKTTSSFTKPVDRVVGEAIALWEKIRPQQPTMLDKKTGEMVQFLFAYRGRMTGKEYINGTLIPVLCRKAGVPESDVRGEITSHRARSTIASQLFNAKEPMSLFELQAWLGHSSPHTTQYYANVTPTKLAQAYADTNYFKRNTRTITVLIDRESIKSGAASQGDPWRYFDLGHGYCSYEFFEQCPHCMACAKCPFYLPKDSTQLLMKEAQGNLVRMKQEMELSDEEIAAIDEGIHLMEQLCSRLADVPTPAGPTPRQLKDK